ncbi:unnamed protein product, partial [Scytosiphon promiscuus]
QPSPRTGHSRQSTQARPFSPTPHDIFSPRNALSRTHTARTHTRPPTTRLLRRTPRTLFFRSARGPCWRSPLFRAKRFDHLMMIVGMMMLGAATKRSHDDGRRRRRRRQGITIRTGGEGWSAVSLLSLLAGAAAQDEDDGAVSVDDGEGESSTNSDIAKAVERWLPLFLGLVLALAVLGWCAVNVYRASKLQSAEEELAAAEAGKGGGKVPGSTSISAAPSRHSSMRQPSLRHPSYRLSGERGGTGDVSPEVDGAIEPKRSLRGSALSSGHQHGALTGAGGAVLLPALLFRGDELQGKKAPGEQGDVYQNPMQRRPRAREVSTPDTSEATQSSGSGRGRHPRTTTKPSSDRNRSSSSDDDEDSDEIVGFNMMELGQGQRGKAGPFASSSSSAAGAGQRGRRASGSSGGNSGHGKGGQASKGAPQKQQ